MPEADLNLSDDQGRSPLLTAVQEGQLDARGALLSHPADAVNVSFQDQKGCTALSLASGKGEISFLQFLLADSRTDTNLQSLEGFTALHFAGMRHSDSSVNMLLQRSDIKVNQQNLAGETPLTLSCNRFRRSPALRLIADNRVDVNFKNAEHSTRLILACSGTKLSAVAADNDELVIALLARPDTDPNVQIQIRRHSPFSGMQDDPPQSCQACFSTFKDECERL